MHASLHHRTLIATTFFEWMVDCYKTENVFGTVRFVPFQNGLQWWAPGRMFVVSSQHRHMYGNVIEQRNKLR